MDNSRYYNDSLAYDFEMFMPRTAEKQNKDNIVKLPQNNPRQKARRKAAVSRMSVSAFAVMTATFMLAAMCGNIFLRLRINEVNSAINDVKAEINVLDSQKTSLEVELERVISYSNIELEAAEIGMQRMSKEQVNYICVNDTDTAVTSDGQVVSSNNE